MMKKWAVYLALFSACSFANAEKVIQCISNFKIDPDVYTRFLQEKGYDGKVVIVKIEDYREDLEKSQGLIHRMLDKVGLDYPWKVKVPENVDKIVFFNLNSHFCKYYDFSRLPKEKMVLFMWEPRTILNRMYHEKIHNCFSKVYTWDDSLVDGVKYFKFNYPALLPMISNPVAFEDKKLCTFISSNVKSKYKKELYSKRKETIVYFEKAHETGFEFYGRRWNPALYSSYKGEAPADKTQTMKNYRFAICYENTYDVDGYISEKIFDCFAAGTVPVYWGAQNIDSFIPKGCFVDRRHFASLEELHAFLKNMDKETYEGYIREIQLFLKSDAAKQFDLPQHLQYFYESIL